MPIKIGTVEVGSILRGSTVINKIYRGTTVIYELADGTFLELIEDITVGTAVDSILINGFTATKEDTLYVVSDLINSSGTNTSPYLYVNGNETASNYYAQRILAEGTSVSGTRQNAPFIGLLDNGTKALITSEIKITNDGYYTVQSSANIKYGGSSIGLNDYYMSSTFTISSITSLKWQTNTGGGKFSAGSRVLIYRLVGA